MIGPIAPNRAARCRPQPREVGTGGATTTIDRVAEHETIVVGAGVIGLSIAFTLATRGGAVTLVDPHPGRGASYVAAGMIAPVTEAAYGEESLVGLSVAAARQWPEFAEQLARYTDLSCGLVRAGTLFVALDANDRARIRSKIPLYESLGLRATWHTRTEIRNFEPLLAPGVAGGFETHDDFQVDNRRLLAALTDALLRLGVPMVRERVIALVGDDRRVRGVLTETRSIDADSVVLALGHDLDSVAGLPPLDRPRLRPVKGQIVRLFQRNPKLRLTHSVRAVVGGGEVYLVPRASGQVVVGATVEEMGTDREPTAGALYGLMRDATAVVPSIVEAEFHSIDVGLRPAAMDNAPIIGPSALDGLIYALGHYRHGILLAPLTASSIADYVLGGSPPEIVAPFLPRLSGDRGPATNATAHRRA